MCPLRINDFPASVQDGLQDLIFALDLVPLKITKDDEPKFYWSFYSDSDCIRQRIEEEDSQFRSWEEMGKVLSLQSSLECANRLYEKSTCFSPLVQLSFDFDY